MKFDPVIHRPPRLGSAGGISRRQFLRSTTLAGVGAPLLLRPGLLRAAPNSKLAHACIGVGGMGLNDLKSFLRHPRVQIVAICDVDAQRLEAAAQLVPAARRYSDWRELLRNEADRLDSVNVSVPDHMHFAIAYSAIRRGKHVYCQKPMCHDVAEVRALTRAAARKGVVTQLGTQLAAGLADRTTVHWLRSGVIGHIRHVYLCSNRPGAVENYRLAGPRPPRGAPPPPHLQWDLWLGTAPQRPYAPDIYHPIKWRAWLDFGTGWSGDIGCHIFDALWKGLELDAPLSVRARVQESWRDSPARRADTWPQANHITWTFPGNARTDGRTLTVEWFDGEFYPPAEIRSLYSLDDYPPECAMFIGTEGALLHVLGRASLLLPEKKFESHPRPKFEPLDHYHQFVDACLGLTQAASAFSVSGPMTEAVLLGTVAVRVPDVELHWDARRMKFNGPQAANRLLWRRYREGWHVGEF